MHDDQQFITSTWQQQYLKIVFSLVFCRLNNSPSSHRSLGCLYWTSDYSSCFPLAPLHLLEVLCQNLDTVLWLSPYECWVEVLLHVSCIPDSCLHIPVWGLLSSQYDITDSYCFWFTKKKKSSESPSVIKMSFTLRFELLKYLNIVLSTCPHGISSYIFQAAQAICHYNFIHKLVLQNACYPSQLGYICYLKNHVLYSRLFMHAIMPDHCTPICDTHMLPICQ